MLGQRLRQARLAAGLSLEDLAERLDQPITKQALSKYERGLSQPPPSRIADLAAALHVRTSSLLAESDVEIKWVAYRKLHRLSKSRQEQVTAVATQRLEGEVRLRELFHLGERHDLPGPINVEQLHDCDYAAAAVRLRWNLGDGPVDSLIERIEEHGCAVVTWPEEWGFDGLSGWANQTPVLVLNESVPPDRLRFNAAHELGHLVMTSTEDGRTDENYAHRFAASFLVPAEAARRELGQQRRGVELEELGLLKQRWGLSMQAWIRRARDLEIIGDDLYGRLNMRFRRQGWHKEEPFEYEAAESPRLLHRLVLRALAEGIITSEEAKRLHPGSSIEESEALASRRSLRDLARRPLDERHEAIRAAGFTVEADEVDAWDGTAGDDLEQ